VNSILATRQQKVLEKKHEIVDMLPEFALKLSSSKLFSSILLNI